MIVDLRKFDLSTSPGIKIKCFDFLMITQSPIYLTFAKVDMQFEKHFIVDTLTDEN